MTERLYYQDSYLREFEARVIATGEDGRRVYLDRTVFYPTSGGQPFDTGMLDTATVLEVIDEGERIAHLTDGPLGERVVRGRIDWPRRYDHMQQHSGQHLLSAVFVELYGMETVSFHLGQEVSTIDLAVAKVDAEQLRAAEFRANEVVCENRPIAVSFHDSQQDLGLRKASERAGTLRLVSIDNLDRSACGGTHLHATGEIGSMVLRRVEKVRNTMRVEFLCGLRAVRRGRADYDNLTRALAEQSELVRGAEKLARRLASDLAVYQGKELYDSTVPDAAGMRRVVERLARGSFEDLRPLAQSFTAGTKAFFAGVIEDPPSVLVAVSADSGIDAGKVLKQALTAAGGRGGGSSRMAQGSVPGKDLLEAVLAAF